MTNLSFALLNSSRCTSQFYQREILSLPEMDSGLNPPSWERPLASECVFAKCFHIEPMNWIEYIFDQVHIIEIGLGNPESWDAISFIYNYIFSIWDSILKLGSRVISIYLWTRDGGNKNSFEHKAEITKLIRNIQSTIHLPPWEGSFQCFKMVTV